MSETSRFRMTPYRKPLWLRLLIPMLVIALSVTFSQVILRDRQIAGVFQSAGKNVADFMAMEIAYRKAQEKGVTLTPAQLEQMSAKGNAAADPLADETQGLAANTNIPASPQSKAEDTSGVRVNRLIGGEVDWTGAKRIRIGQPE